MLPLTNENLPLANFDLFNEAYGEPAQDCCPDCIGKAGTITWEYQGDPPMGGMVTFFEACDSCIGQELCPGCMQPLALSFDVSAFEPQSYKLVNNHIAKAFIRYEPSYLSFSYEDALSNMPTASFECLVCSWQYDPDRHYDNDDYYEDEADHDFNHTPYDY